MDFLKQLLGEIYTWFGHFKVIELAAPFFAALLAAAYFKRKLREATATIKTELNEALGSLRAPGDGDHLFRCMTTSRSD